MSGPCLPILSQVDILNHMNEVTQILGAIERGDPHAAEKLLPLVYDELRKLAAAQMAQEKPGQTLDATALVHEAYIRLVGPADDRLWENRGHFFATAAEAIRRILVDSARRKRRLKRGGDRQLEAIDLNSLAGAIPDEELLSLHDALEQFAIHDPVKARLVELRFFSGLSLPEIAGQLGISLSTTERGWRFARAWLYAAMSGEDKKSEIE